MMIMNTSSDITGNILTSTINNSTVTPRSNFTYVLPFNQVGVVVSSVIIFTFLICGLVGNTLTIIVIPSYKSLSQSIFMRFILSLCVSDLISALISWLFLYRRTWGFDVWEPLPDFFCKIYWAVDFMTSYATSLHIISFALLRFYSLRFPFQYAKIKHFHANIFLAVIWIICFCCGFIPFWLFYGVTIKDRSQLGVVEDAGWPACTVLLSEYEKYQKYQKIAYPLFFFVPLAIIVTVCLGMIVLIVVRARAPIKSKEDRKLRKKEKQAIVQLAFIIFSFLIGYVPFIVYEFWSVSYVLTGYNDRLAYWFNVAQYMCLRFSECLNPVFYNLGSEKMRTATKMFLKKIFCCLKHLSSGNAEKKQTAITSDIGPSKQYGISAI